MSPHAALAGRPAAWGGKLAVRQPPLRQQVRCCSSWSPCGQC